MTPISVCRMYEWAEQTDPAFHWWALDYTSLTNDNPEYTCVHGGNDLYYHWIAKQATYQGQRLTDDINPNFSSASIGSQTYHLLRIVDLVVTTCGWYRPFG